MIYRSTRSQLFNRRFATVINFSIWIKIIKIRLRARLKKTNNHFINELWSSSFWSLSAVDATCDWGNRWSLRKFNEKLFHCATYIWCSSIDTSHESPTQRISFHACQTQSAHTNFIKLKHACSLENREFHSKSRTQICYGMF